MISGTSHNQKRSRFIGGMVALLVLGLAGIASAQTGQVMPPPKFEAWDSAGDPCNGCKLYAYAAGTTTPQDTYTSSALSTPNANPVVLDSAGRATVFLDPTLSYKFTLKTSADVEIYTVDNVVGSFSGVVTITAADTRGLQISRSSADAGLSIASSGGSGKTYGIVSNTSGALLIRDDADGTPNLTISGNDITTTQTGTFTVSGGLFAQSGAAGDHLFSGSVDGPNRLGIRNTSGGTAALSSFLLGTDAATNTGALFALGSGYTTSGSYVQNGVSLEATRVGGLSLNASNASGDIRLYTGANTTPRMTIVDNGAVAIGVTSTTRDMELLSTGDGITGGFVVSRSDATEILMNADDGAPGTGFGTIQARDGSGYLPTKLSPSGGGISIGGGGTILSVITGTTTWDIPSKINGAMEATTLTVTGVQATSPCIVGFHPNTTGTTLSGITMSAYYDGADTVRVVALNTSGSTIDPTSATLRVTCFTY